MSDGPEHAKLAELTAEIVSAYVSHHQVALADLGDLIGAVAERLKQLGQPAEPPPEPKAEPAVPVRRSITPDHLVCLICGKRQKLLKRHLSVEHDLTPHRYRETFGLGSDYPMVAPAYRERRRELALVIGLGQSGRPARRRRTRQPQSPANEPGS